jgi:hypothetical protein
VSEPIDIPIRLLIDGTPTPAYTTATSAGAYVLILATVLTEPAISLYSTYAGHQRTNTLATHLLLASGAYETISAEHDHDQLPLMYARRHCLYDHLHRLQDLLKNIGIDAQIPLDDAAIAAVER